MLDAAVSGMVAGRKVDSEEPFVGVNKVIVISHPIWISKSSLELFLRIWQSRFFALVPQSMRDLLSRNLLRDLKPNMLLVSP